MAVALVVGLGLGLTFGLVGPGRPNRVIDPARSTMPVLATGCSQPSRGVGVIVGADLVITNAHVVAGADDVEVGGLSAITIGFDPELDLALLTVAGLARPAVELGQPQQGGDEGTLVAIDAVGEMVHHHYSVRRWIWATGEDIHGRPGARRRVDELDMTFSAGWSGSGLFSNDGHLVGIAFAQSRRRPNVAYAVSAVEVDRFLEQTSAGGEPVSAGDCIG